MSVDRESPDEKNAVPAWTNAHIAERVVVMVNSPDWESVCADAIRDSREACPDHGDAA